MTENEVLIKTPEEAIETIKSNMPTSGYQMLRESLDMAIKALEEIQQYREIGTVEECRKALIENLMQEIPLAENVHIFRDIIENQPTAFDKEKVIEELNEKADYARNRWLNSTKEGQTKYWEGKENGIREAIEIVKKGGIE